MACILFWMSLTILSNLLNASLEGTRESVNNIPREYSNSMVWWHPYYSLKEYHSFKDAKIYVLNVPEYTYEMKLSFHYQGMYLNSHKPCNNSINILFQHGSPAIPYQDQIQADGLFYNNTDHCETSVSLSRPQNKNISSPLPGKWYVTAFLPYVEEVKKIKEKGLAKTDDKCLSALSIEQVLISPSKPPIVLAKGQRWKSTANPRLFTTTYYKYFVSSYSKELRVELNITCPNRQRNCSLKLSLSASSLPTQSSLSCMAPCVLKISWPQPEYYYIEVQGTSLSYEITANHKECLSNTNQDCTEITPMMILNRRNLVNSWLSYLFNTTNVFSLTLQPDYVGTTLTFLVRPFYGTTGVTYKMCITKDLLPFNQFSKKYCSEKSDGDLRMEFVYPQSGTWYVIIFVQSHNQFSKAALFFHAKTQTCLESCNKHGSCVIKSDIGISYGLCECDYGYTGFTCSSYQSLDVLAVCLLTISNIAFIPGIIVACSRKFYPEAIVYLFNMYCSTVYHACDSHGYCVYDYNTLQLSDFYASVLSVWFTLVTMIKMRSLWHRTLNIVSLLSLFIGVQLSRFGVLVTAVPGGIGLLFVFVSFGYRCRKRQKCFPSPKRWLIFLLPAFVLASTAIAIYTGLETTSNYKYLHSVWHITIASCIPLLLPTVRKPKLYVDYHQVNGDESLRDSDESLLMNVRNTTDHNDSQESEEITFPRLIT